jgi:hypothetical protein
VVLKLIDFYNEKIEKSGEGKDSEVFKQKKEDLVILQLNTDQEQHERIQAIRELKESLENELEVEGFLPLRVKY